MGNNYKKISASIQDENDKIIAEKEEYAMNLYEHIIEIKATIGRIETKVDIHNNYEDRIRSLERNQYKFMGVLIVVVILVQIAIKIFVKQQ